jgi:lysophospholipid acyltransferase (LPLAT)-like uncharacterized protein
VELAKLTGRPIIPLGFTSAKGRTNHKRWDKLLDPVPFDTICFTYGAPIFVSKEMPREMAMEHVARALDEMDSR